MHATCAGLPKVFWVEVVTTTAYLINSCPSTTLVMKTPMEVRSGQLASYENLRVSRCTTYARFR